MKTRALLAFCMLLSLVFTVTAVETNYLSAHYMPESVFPETQSVTPDFWELFKDKLGDNKTARNRLGYLTHLSWERTLKHNGYGIHDMTAYRGRKIFLDTTLGTFRDASVDYFPFEEWGESAKVASHKFRKSFLWGLFKGSVGNSEENERDLVSSVPYYSSDAEYWSLYPNGPLRMDYGVRLFYIYISADIGHQPGSSLPVVHTDTRLRFGNLHSFDSDGFIRLPKVEEQLVFPLPKNVRLIFGGSFEPMSLMYYSSGDVGARASVRLERSFRYRKLNGLISLGGERSRQERIISLRLDLAT